MGRVCVWRALREQWQARGVRLLLDERGAPYVRMQGWVVALAAGSFVAGLGGA